MLRGQLEPLALAAGERGERLAEAEVAEPDVGEPLEDLVRCRRLRLAGAEELLGLDHRHREHLADVLAAELVLEHLGLEALPLAHLAGGGDAGHHRQVGVDHAGAVAVGAGALGVGAEQRRLDAVLLRERLADRVEQPGVGRRVAAPRASDRRLVDRDDPVASGRVIEPSISELLPEPATPVTTTSTPSGMSTSTSCRLWVSAPRTSRAPVRRRAPPP